MAALPNWLAPLAGLFLVLFGRCRQVAADAYLSRQDLLPRSTPQLLAAQPSAMTADDTGRIFGGERVYKGQYPHHAILSTRAQGVLCGGSLISDRWIVTVAHCVAPYNASVFDISLGVLHVYYNESSKPMWTLSEKVVVHPEFDASKKVHQNDIALVKTKDRIEYTESIRPIHWDYSHQDVSDCPERRLVSVVGFGRTYPGSLGPTSEFPKMLTAPLTKRCDCNLRWFDTQECVKSNEKGDSLCKGDAGGGVIGPLGSQTHALYGVAATYECRNGSTFTFTPIVPYRDWIAAETIF